jgi:hypothetical protein
MAVNTRLVEAAMRLRGEAPESWDEFVLAMREYAAATTSEVVRCPPELLLRAQGMALCANDLAMTLLNAPKLYDKMRING